MLWWRRRSLPEPVEKVCQTRHFNCRQLLEVSYHLYHQPLQSIIPEQVVQSSYFRPAIHPTIICTFKIVCLGKPGFLRKFDFYLLGLEKDLIGDKQPDGSQSSVVFWG